MSGKHESMVCRSGSASKHGECQLILSFSEQARRVSCLNLRAKCNGRTALVVCSLWLVQCESKRTQHQQKCGGELRSVAGVMGRTQRLDGVHKFCYSSNAACRMSCVTIGAMPAQNWKLLQRSNLEFPEAAMSC